jgi:hypothetical protein
MERELEGPKDLMLDVRCQMSDVRCQMSDVRCQMSDVRSKELLAILFFKLCLRQKSMVRDALRTKEKLRSKILQKVKQKNSGC